MFHHFVYGKEKVYLSDLGFSSWSFGNDVMQSYKSLSLRMYGHYPTCHFSFDNAFNSST